MLKRVKYVVIYFNSLKFWLFSVFWLFNPS